MPQTKSIEEFSLIKKHYEKSQSFNFWYNIDIFISISITLRNNKRRRVCSLNEKYILRQNLAKMPYCVLFSTSKFPSFPPSPIMGMTRSEAILLAPQVTVHLSPSWGQKNLAETNARADSSRTLLKEIGLWSWLKFLFLSRLIVMKGVFSQPSGNLLVAFEF